MLVCKATETVTNIKFVFGEESIIERTAQRWIQKLFKGNESLNDVDSHELLRYSRS